MSSISESGLASRSAKAHTRRGWTHLQRRDGQAVRDWLHRERRLRIGFEALALALRGTLHVRVRKAADALDVWHSVPAVLEECNEPATYRKRQVEMAYAWLYLLERYVRTWLSLERLLR